MAAKVATLVIDQAQFPPDQPINPDSARHKGYERIDQSLNARQAAAIHASAKAIAAELTADAARLSTLLGGCSGTPECLDAFIRRAGRLLFRQPLSDAEVAVYRNAAGGATSAAAITKVLATMIASPKTFFVIERGQAVDSGTNCAPLTAHELATRLALHLWDSVPDAALNAAADDGTLLQPAVYGAQVTRMLADAKADRAHAQLLPPVVPARRAGGARRQGRQRRSSTPSPPATGRWRPRATPPSPRCWTWSPTSPRTTARCSRC